ncbi:putative DNA-binding protein (MmcQ/YjbR family) [Pseudoduganella flava]|uniref:MmcQ/YjbR family DNA-binding protein n=1 Tax=Pseudoduganella flava TaxID=871742 RepID=A0A562PND6_9BURK|nr:MmcQ/YjbR family DNA-binding protein [Pseudoduganella flava]QGZ40486.1 MmcQ/YjbR family DNA-binding protein [Pseudoduganella flava]TWI45929.1 putative DNA-binding protein (MmcQ/YjbR family) [Pseudoduganella flava]
MNIEKAKKFCAGLHGATQDVKWECFLVFAVGGKMFAMTHVDPKVGWISFKVDDDAFLALTDRPGIIPAPYLARAKWVQIENPKAVSDAEAQELLRRSHEIVFGKLTKKLQREIAEENE